VAAAFAFALNSFLSPEALHSWGWRVPFLLGIIIGPVGFYLRRAIDETPDSRPISNVTPVWKTPRCEMF